MTGVIDSTSFTELNEYMTLNNNDLVKIQNILDGQEDKFEKKIDKFKNEFYERIDPILKEIPTAREARTLMENRIEKLEEIHTGGKHGFPD